MWHVIKNSLTISQIPWFFPDFSRCTKFSDNSRFVGTLVLHVARWNTGLKNALSGHHRTSLSGYIFASKDVSTIGKNLLSSNISPTCSYNIVNFGRLAAEIDPAVWGTPANFNGFRILAALLHGTPVLGVSQTLRHWAEGATYIWQGGHHIGHRPTF